MTNHADLLRQALDALLMAQVDVQGALYSGVKASRIAAAIDAIRAELAAPVETVAMGVPVGWIDEFGNVFSLGAWVKSEVREKWKPLYTSPPAQPAPAPEELSPEFTDTARAALLWVLWHHQGASSAVGQPIRFALGMGAHDRLNGRQIAEAKQWATTTGSTTAEFHKVPAAPAVPDGMVMMPREPTSNMLAALSGEWHPSRHEGFHAKYRAMLAAAPGSAPAAPAVREPAIKKPIGDQAATDTSSATTAMTAGSPAINGALPLGSDAMREPHEPYLCIKPACGPDCSGCNCAISPQDMRDYAIRYAILRNAPINAIRDGGVFAGKTPDNVVLNGEHLDAAVDALRGITGDSK